MVTGLAVDGSKAPERTNAVPFVILAGLADWGLRPIRDFLTSCGFEALDLATGDLASTDRRVRQVLDDHGLLSVEEAAGLHDVDALRRLRIEAASYIQGRQSPSLIVASADLVTLPFWGSVLRSRHTILCVRRPDEGALQHLRDDPTAENFEGALRDFVRFYGKAGKFSWDSVVDFTHLLAAPYEVIRRILREVGTDWSADALERQASAITHDSNTLKLAGGPVRQSPLLTEAFDLYGKSSSLQVASARPAAAEVQLVSAVEHLRQESLEEQRRHAQAIERLLALENFVGDRLTVLGLSVRKQIQDVESASDERSERTERVRQDAMREVERLRNEIVAIQSTTGWRLLGRLRRFVPPGSLQHGVLRRLRAGIGALRQRKLRAAIRAFLYGPPPPAWPDDYDKIWHWLDQREHEGIRVGQSSLARLQGWCFHPSEQIAKLTIRLGERQVVANSWAFPRFDVLDAMADVGLAMPNALLCGFRVEIPAAGLKGDYEVQGEALLSDGRTMQFDLGTVALNPVEWVASDVAADLVICMTTFNPKIHLFRRQVDSIRAQTYRNWRCIITDDLSDPETLAMIADVLGDDPRFELHRNPVRLGFYKNFEACLGLVPRTASYVALSDQDDWWSPDKLEVLVGELAGGATLAYSDMEIVTDTGNLVSPSYWKGRRNNFRDFDLLLLANTVTGAASVFRGDLLTTLLPFPQASTGDFHDQWIACAAMACGEIRYTERALYQYTQHGANVIGHWVPRPHRLVPVLAWAVKWLTWSRDEKRQRRQEVERFWLQYRSVWRIAFWSRQLRERVAVIRPDKRRALELFATIDRSPGALLKVAWIGLIRGRGTVLGAHWYLMGCAIGTSLFKRFARSNAIPLAETALREAQARAATLPLSPPPPQEPPEPVMPPDLKVGMYLVDQIPQKIAPLQIEIDPNAPRRVNFVIPTIDFKYFFGGYINVFNLALRLKRHGLDVRMVTTDWTDMQPELWREQISKFEDLKTFFEEVPVENCFDRRTTLVVSPNDRFIANCWWTAHICGHASASLRRKEFVYLCLEYEPFTFPHDSYYALAQHSYEFPHVAMFSTEFLRDYFRQNQIGVYAKGERQGDEASVSFQNTIGSTPPSREGLTGRTKRRLLFYARPEAHAARNCFPLAMIALKLAIESGAFDAAEWEFYGIGAVSGATSVPLTQTSELHLLPRMGLDEYHRLLPSYDIGLAMILTPHPSLVPLDMAAAGLITVTNTYENKTKAKIEAISSNLIAGPPTLEGIRDALIQATARVSDVDARLAGSHLDWARTWDQAFNEQVMARAMELIGT